MHTVLRTAFAPGIYTTWAAIVFAVDMLIFALSALRQ